MPKRTINLSYEEDGAAIFILRGFHDLEPIGNFSITGKFDHCYMWVRTDEVVEILLGYERALERAKKDGDTSQEHILWLYVRDELIGDYRDDIDSLDEDESFREKYLHATGR